MGLSIFPTSPIARYFSVSTFSRSLVHLDQRDVNVEVVSSGGISLSGLRVGWRGRRQIFRHFSDDVHDVFAEQCRETQALLAMGHRAVSHFHFVRSATELARRELVDACLHLRGGEAHGVAREIRDSARGCGLAIG
jgi:hypothetical protein